MNWYANLKHVQMRTGICACTCIVLISKVGKHPSVPPTIYKEEERNGQMAFSDDKQHE